MLIPSLKRERLLWRQGIISIAGVDEAGRGAWAGALVAGAVVFAPKHKQIKNVRDSKLLSPRQREEIYAAIIATAIAWAVGVVESSELDRIGLGEANRIAMYRAIAALSQPPQHVFIDALKLPKLTIPYEAVIDGDAKIYTVAAASIIAKVTRDRMMVEWDAQYPHYAFGKHKGYGTELHQRALAQHGPCAIHRQSFAPVKSRIRN